jgi:hypothetical protein
MRHTTAILLVTCLALAGCSSGGSGKPTPAVTVTKTPKLSAAEQRAACITAWGAVIDEEDPATPAECGGLKDQAGMYMEALHKRNAANREKFDECTRNPSCTEWPVATP